MSKKKIRIDEEMLKNCAIHTSWIYNEAKELAVTMISLETELEAAVSMCSRILYKLQDARDRVMNIRKNAEELLRVVECD